MSKRYSTRSDRLLWMKRNLKALVKLNSRNIVQLMKRDGLISPKTYYADIKVEKMLQEVSGELKKSLAAVREVLR